MSEHVKCAQLGDGDAVTETVVVDHASVYRGVRRVMRAYFAVFSVGLGLVLGVGVLFANWGDTVVALGVALALAIAVSFVAAALSFPFLMSLRDRSLPMTVVGSGGVIVQRLQGTESRHNTSECAWYVGNLLDSPVAILLSNPRPLFVVDGRKKGLILCGTTVESAARWRVFFRSQRMPEMAPRTPGRLISRAGLAAVSGLIVGHVFGSAGGYLAELVTGQVIYSRIVWSGALMLGPLNGLLFVYCRDLHRALAREDRRAVYIVPCIVGGLFGVMCALGGRVPLLGCLVITTLLLGTGLVCAFMIVRWTQSRFTSFPS